MILNRNLRHFYSARHFVGTISLYLEFYIVFFVNYFSYHMAKPVLRKSLCSDWFFLGQDFAVRTISNPCIFVLEQSRQIQNLQPKQQKKNCEYCHSSQQNYQKKLKRLKLFWNFKEWPRRQTFSKPVLLSWRPGNFWCRNWNRHHRKPGGHRRFYQPTEKCKHKQEDGYWYELSSPLHGS